MDSQRRAADLVGDAADGDLAQFRRREFELDGHARALAAKAALATRQPSGMKENHTGLRTDDLAHARGRAARNAEGQLRRKARRQIAARIDQLAFAAKRIVIA